MQKGDENGRSNMPVFPSDNAPASHSQFFTNRRFEPKNNTTTPEFFNEAMSSDYNPTPENKTSKKKIIIIMIIVAALIAGLSLLLVLFTSNQGDTKTETKNEIKEFGDIIMNGSTEAEPKYTSMGKRIVYITDADEISAEYVKDISDRWGEIISKIGESSLDISVDNINAFNAVVNALSNYYSYTLLDINQYYEIYKKDDGKTLSNELFGMASKFGDLDSDIVIEYNIAYSNLANDLASLFMAYYRGGCIDYLNDNNLINNCIDDLSFDAYKEKISNDYDYFNTATLDAREDLYKIFMKVFGEVYEK